MFRTRVVVPVAVCVVTAIIAVVPFVTTAAADSSAVAVDIHDNGGDISGWGFGPASISVAAGQTVTFSNSGTSPHDATATVTFSTPGTFGFTCVLHPWMQGTIVVAPAASTPDVPPASNPAPQSDPSTQPSTGDASGSGGGN